MPDTTRSQRPMLEALRAEIRRLERPKGRSRAVLPFGLPLIDQSLPEGGLTLGSLHEVAGGGADLQHGAAAARFCAGIAARTRGQVLWCVTRQDLFAPALQQAGLSGDRVIYVQGHDNHDVLACFEEGLRHGGGLGAVIADISRLSMTASRRLQLAAEASGVPGIALRRQYRQSGTADFGQPSAAVTRWRVSALPSVALPVAGVGRPRWYLELLRCRAGTRADFIVEACDDTGRLGLSADMANGPGQEATGFRRAIA